MVIWTFVNYLLQHDNFLSKIRFLVASLQQNRKSDTDSKQAKLSLATCSCEGESYLWRGVGILAGSEGGGGVYSRVLAWSWSPEADCLLPPPLDCLCHRCRVNNNHQIQHTKRKGKDRQKEAWNSKERNKSREYSSYFSMLLFYYFFSC